MDTEPRSTQVDPTQANAREPLQKNPDLHPEPGGPVDGYADASDPSDNRPQEGDETRGTFERMADDLEAGRISTQVAVSRLFRGLAAQERGDDAADVEAAFYPGEAEGE